MGTIAGAALCKTIIGACAGVPIGLLSLSTFGEGVTQIFGANRGQGYNAGEELARSLWGDAGAEIYNLTDMGVSLGTSTWKFYKLGGRGFSVVNRIGIYKARGPYRTAEDYLVNYGRSIEVDLRNINRIELAQEFGEVAADQIIEMAERENGSNSQVSIVTLRAQYKIEMKGDSLKAVRSEK